MLLRKFSQTLRVSMALMVAVFSTGILPTTAAYATHTASKTINAHALDDYDCIATEWHFIINQVSPEDHAPASINVTFANDNTEVVNLDRVNGRSASYTTTSNLTSNVTSATTEIYNSWSGQFVLSHGPCETGSLSVETDCEEITFSASTFSPEGATVTFTLNGEAKDADTYKVSAGEYTVVMLVNGTEVDRQTVQIDECATPSTGTLVISTDCEEITFGFDTFSPEGATVTFTLNGEAKDADTYKVSAGEYTVVMLVNGTEVDRQTVQIDECATPPAGTLAVRVNCESITFRATVVEPSRATVTFELNGVEVEDGQHVVPAGEYTIDLYVNGTKVDTETRTVTECEPDKKTELCHATHSETNPYELIDVSVSAAFHGHLGDGNGDHQDGEDIIPPFQYRGNTYSQNWPSGQDIFENGCVEPDDEVPTADIEATVICVTNGVRVTLTNSGDADGTATVNGEEYDVPANDTTEVTLDFDLGTPFKTAVKVMVGESTLIDRIVSCGNLLGTTDVCPNIEGTQTVVPAGLIRNPTTGECFTPGGRGAFTPAQVLGAATALPETLPSTGGADSPLAIIIASILAYGAAYFLQGRRLLGRKEALSA